MAVSDMGSELGVDVKSDDGQLLGLVIGSTSHHSYGKGNGAMQSLVKAIWQLQADTSTNLRIEAQMRDDYPEFGVITSLRVESRHQSRLGTVETMRGGRIAKVVTGFQSYWWAWRGGDGVVFLPQGADDLIIHQFIFDNMQSDQSKSYQNLLASLSFDQSDASNVIYILEPAKSASKYPGGRSFHESKVISVITNRR